MFIQSAVYPITYSPISNHTKAYQRSRTTRSYKVTLAAINYGLISLPANVKSLYKILNEYDKPNSKGFRKGCVWVSSETLAERIGKSKRTIERWLKELEDVGLIERKRRANRSSLICFCDVLEAQLAEYLTTKQTLNPQSVDNTSADVACPHQKSASKMSFAYIDEEIEENNNMKQLQYSEAGEDVVLRLLDDLVKLGFNPYLARLFVTRFGVNRVERQFVNLCLVMRVGVIIRSIPRWLYRAIQRDYQYGNGEGTGPCQTPKPPTKHWEITEIDEATQTAYVTEQSFL